MRCPTLVLVSLAFAACHTTTSDSSRATLAERLHQDVAWLADDAREGRRAGTEQGRVAGEWIADRMSELGLEPAGTGGGFEQEFTVPLEPRSGGKSWIAVGRARIEEGPLAGAMAADAAVGETDRMLLAPLFASERGEASGPVAYCGYGIELTQPDAVDDKGHITTAGTKWDDFAGRDLTGKIAIVVRGSPASAPTAAKSAGGAAANPHGGASSNPHGAAASDRNAAAPANSQGGAQADPHGAQADPHGAPANPHGAPANPHGAAPTDTVPRAHGDTQLVTAGDPFVNAGLVFIKVMNAKRKGASAVVLVQHPSDAGKPVLAFHEGGSGRAGMPCISLSWKSAQELFGARLDTWTKDLESKPARADAVDERVFTVSADVERGHGSAVNILGLVPGVDRSRIVVLGAHYDHLGFGGTGSLAPNQRAVHNGADDNASGTAAVLEIARELRAGPPPACDVLIALWSGEELGLLGSEYWAKKPTVPFEGVVGNVNLDMVGRAGNGKLQVLGAGSAAEFSAWLAESGPAAKLELTVNASSSAMAGSSDHATFAKRKKPVLHLFSGLHTDYHKPTDDIERFEVEGAVRVVDLSLDLVRRMAEARSLAFVEPPPAAEGSERRMQSGFNAWFGSIPNYAFEGPGVKIDGTSSGSPAERAGFLAGDVLMTIGEVKIENVYDLTYALQHYKPGDVVLVAFERDEKREETRVTLSSRGLR